MAEKDFVQETERAILGAIIKRPTLLRECSALTADDFKLECHRTIFQTIIECELTNVNIDTFVIADKISSRGKGSTEKTKAYLDSMIESVKSEDGFKDWIDIVKKDCVRRKQEELGRMILTEVQKGESELLNDKILSSVNTIIRNGTTSGPVNMENAVIQAFTRLQNLAGPNREKYLGIKTGFADLDSVILGMSPGDLILIGARPAMGKTAFALNIARHVSLIDKKRVLFFSLEMSTEQLMERLLATETHIDSKKIRMAQMDREEWAQLNAAATYLKDMNLLIDDTTNITVAEIKSKAVQTQAELIVIDYLSLMKSGSKAESRVQEISQITRELKLMAKALKIPVIVLSQLNRAVEKGDNHKPQLADLRESGSIEQDADVVLMLYRDSYYRGDINPEQAIMINGVQVDVATVFVRKNRHGSVADVHLAWIPEWTMFDNLPEGVGKNG